jgi:hypothetical protein
MLHFCTYFDANYLSRGLALYGSLRRHCGNFEFWVLTLDEPTRRILESLALPSLRCLSIEALEASDPDLLLAKANRPKIEYYLTCGPAFMLELMRRNPSIDLLTYLDADLFFFNDPKPALDELAAASIGLASHRIENAKSRELYGEFNVGWLSFRSDCEGVAALKWWRDRCLESCSIDDPASGICGDQKYLDQVPRRFGHVVVLHHPGANIAFWNYASFRYDVRNGVLLVQGEPLLWFHFGEFHLRAGFWLSRSYATRPFFPSRLVRQRILGRYARVLFQLDRKLSHAITSLVPDTAVQHEDLYAQFRKRAQGPPLIAALRSFRAALHHVFLPHRRYGENEPEVTIVLPDANEGATTG